jgi:Protein of unknown function (DUF3179)
MSALALRLRTIQFVIPLSLLAACTSQDDLQGQEVWKTDFSRSTVDASEIVSGGPPKDGIPAIDHPNFESVKKANKFIDDDEPVAVVRRGGEVKAYPLQILIWHEIVNDVVGGEPVTVTYCPLCNTTLAFDRNFEGQVLDFGTTGRLRFADLVMYDRQTETWWQQATGEGIVGRYAGHELTFIPSPVMRWRDVKEQLPEALVLSRDTGYPSYKKRYGFNPYQGYDTRRGPFEWTFGGKASNKLPRMERVVSLKEGGESLAIPFSALKEHRLAEVEVGGRDVVVFFTPKTVSSVDAQRIMNSRRVGSSAAYDPKVDGRKLTFEPAKDDGTYRDRETGSLWNFSGQAVEGELAGKTLEEVPHGNHFWFAWAVFQPETKVWEG